MRNGQGDNPRLYAAILDYLESVERCGPLDGSALAADCPDLAAEVREFAEAHVRLERLTAPVRQLTRVLMGELTLFLRSVRIGLEPFRRSAVLPGGRLGSRPHSRPGRPSPKGRPGSSSRLPQFKPTARRNGRRRLTAARGRR
jgi:hypothetical protein